VGMSREGQRVEVIAILCALGLATCNETESRDLGHMGAYA